MRSDGAHPAMGGQADRGGGGGPPTAAEDARIAVAVGDLAVVTGSDVMGPSASIGARLQVVVPRLVEPGLGPEATIAPVGWTPAWRQLSARPGRAAAKRGLDVAVAAVALLALAPVLIAVAVGVRLTSPGPVIFRQERLARGGGTFRMWKFRTMEVDADARLQALLRTDPGLAEEFARTQKLQHDPRITRIGGALRRTSLDELPQLVNVLLGHMSLVGPRPIVRDEVPRYGEHVGTVLSVRPGITGIWQLSGRNDLPYWRRVQLDALYVAEHTIAGDLLILLTTIRVLLPRGGRGAY